MVKTFSLKLLGLEAGEHKLKIVAEDQVGHRSEREIEFEYIPATGISDDYVMQHFPLPDGEGNEAEEENPVRPELAVNVMNGNLVFRQQDVEVTGPGADLEVERFYNSQLPEGQNSEWGSGWTLAQAPELDIEQPPSGPATDAVMLQENSAVEGSVALPTQTGEEKFDKEIQAVVTKEANGYEVADESGETGSAVAFNEAGEPTELRSSGSATVEIESKAGAISELAVNDPGTAGGQAALSSEELAETHIYALDFGERTSGPGDLSGPLDAVTDKEGNVWVADAGHSRVQEFNSKGEFLQQFGGAGTGNGQLSGLRALALDAQGDVWVAAGSRVQEFSPKGEFVRGFGSSGASNGQFMGLADLALDAQGNVWTLEAGEALSKPRLQKFTPEGAYLAKLEFERGKENGQLSSPQAFAIDAAGDFWIADTGNGRVEEFSAAGAFLRASGSSGTANGQFSGPRGIALDSAGNAWVADTGNNRIQELSATGVYLAQFGKSGPNDGQFSEPKGLTVDAGGNVWVADAANNRVERWQLPGWSSTFLDPAAVGTEGSGQLAAPGGIATDPTGNVWIADTANNRIAEFDSKGAFLQQFGTAGSANGQFNEPTAIDIDASGNVWVADRGNNRLQELDSQGALIRKFGTAGSGDGQFGRLEDIAIDAEGHVWTVELGAEAAGKPRVQEFTAEGAYLAQFGSEGTGPGQFKAPQGVTVDAQGNVWVADTGNKRVQKFSSKGQYLYGFGTAGAEEGHLAAPAGIATDSAGNVWVADAGNDRVSEFSTEGIYLRQFGATGSGSGQLSNPQSLAFDSAGNLWVADTANNRAEEWIKTSLPSDPPPPAPDPRVEVKTSSGFVSSVEGEEAGTTTYVHAGEKLTAVSGPKGNTAYEYDTSDRLKKVTLPNGTWGEVQYDAVGRVAWVRVSIEGAAATATYFSYSETPRRTVVTPEKGKVLTYDIAPDGSILKWWNSTKAPTIEPLEGSLWWQRGEIHPEPVTLGDQSLTVLAKSLQGIASIQIVANGNQLVSEKACEQDWSNEEIECQKVEKTFVTETENWPPGVLQLEVIVTDREGLISTQRFWDNIPYTPPPDPEALEPPRFEDVKRFREEFGLDLDLNGNEHAINERIFQLIEDWHEPSTAGGALARATTERWGVPLRQVDVAEMEYREWYLEVAGPKIEEWAQSHFPGSYAGYEVDHRAGGIIRISFTEAQDARVGEFLQEMKPPAGDRITAARTVPIRPLESLEDLEGEVVGQMDTDPVLQSNVVSVEIPEGKQVISVSAIDVPTVEARLSQLFGSLASFAFVTASGFSEPMASRERKGGRMLAGDWAWTDWTPEGSPLFTRGSGGFGAVEDKFSLQDKSVLHVQFLLGAGHEGNTGAFVYREQNGLELTEQQRRERGEKIGRVGRDAFWEGARAVDALATRLNSDGLAPFNIFGGGPVGPAKVAWKGEPLCASGAKTGHIECGHVIGFRQVHLEGNPVHTIGEIFVKGLETHKGDSGAPVWNPRTGASIGIISAHPHPNSKNCEVQPLLTTLYGRYKQKRLVGALDASVMGSGSLHLIQGK